MGAGGGCVGVVRVRRGGGLHRDDGWQGGACLGGFRCMRFSQECGALVSDGPLRHTNPHGHALACESICESFYGRGERLKGVSDTGGFKVSCEFSPKALV